MNISICSIFFYNNFNFLKNLRKKWENESDLSLVKLNIISSICMSRLSLVSLFYMKTGIIIGVDSYLIISTPLLAVKFKLEFLKCKLNLYEISQQNDRLMQ